MAILLEQEAGNSHSRWASAKWVRESQPIAGRPKAPAVSRIGTPK